MTQIRWVDMVSEKIKEKTEVIQVHGGVSHRDWVQATLLAWPPDRVV